MSFRTACIAGGVIALLAGCHPSDLPADPDAGVSAGEDLSSLSCDQLSYYWQHQMAGHNSCQQDSDCFLVGVPDAAHRSCSGYLSMLPASCAQAASSHPRIATEIETEYFGRCHGREVSGCGADISIFCRQGRCFTTQSSCAGSGG